MKVGELMTTPVYCITPDETLNQAAAMMKRHGVGSLPVCEGPHVVGMLTDRDIVMTCAAAGTNPAACQVSEVMTSEPVAVSPDVELEDVVDIMAREQVRRLPVMSGDELVGLISLGDLALALDDDRLVARALREVSTPA